MMHTRYALVLLAALVLPFIGGCAAYTNSVIEVIEGVPEERVTGAKARLEGEEDTEIGLTTDKQTLEDETKRLNDELSKLTQRVEEQKNGISEAVKKNNVDRAKELELRQKIDSLDDAIRTAQNQLDAARASKDTEQEKALKAKLEELQKDVGELDEEINVLLQ